MGDSTTTVYYSARDKEDRRRYFVVTLSVPSTLVRGFLSPTESGVIDPLNATGRIFAGDATVVAVNTHMFNFTSEPGFSSSVGALSSLQLAEGEVDGNVSSVIRFTPDQPVIVEETRPVKNPAYLESLDTTSWANRETQGNTEDKDLPSHGKDYFLFSEKKLFVSISPRTTTVTAEQIRTAYEGEIGLVTETELYASLGYAILTFAFDITAPFTAVRTVTDDELTSVELRATVMRTTIYHPYDVSPAGEQLLFQRGFRRILTTLSSSVSPLPPITAAQIEAAYAEFGTLKSVQLDLANSRAILVFNDDIPTTIPSKTVEVAGDVVVLSGRAVGGLTFNNRELTVYGSVTRALDAARLHIYGKELIPPDFLLGNYRTFYENGSPWKIYTYASTGWGGASGGYLDHTRPANSYLTGRYVEYYNTGDVYYETTFSLGLITGRYREFYPSGGLKCTANFFRGRLNGQYVQWSDGGSREYVCFFRDGDLKNSVVFDYT